MISLGIQQILDSRGAWGQLFRKVRRFYYGAFKSDEVKKRISETRQGECHRCGECCELLFKCPFLGKDGHGLSYCRIYGELRPGSCRNYPFDVRDSEVQRCGYKFKK